jgi:hypothetical protein
LDFWSTDLSDDDIVSDYERYAGTFVPGEDVALSDATPDALGTPSAGTATVASRGDHVHAMPSASDVGAIAVSVLTTDGDSLIRAGGVPARFPLGSALQVRRVNAAGTAEEFATFTASLTASALADLSGTLGASNAFHLLEPSGAFTDRGSAPVTLTEVGTFRRARLGPRALVPGVWVPDPAGRSCLAFNPATASMAWTVGVTVRANGETIAGGGRLLYLFGSIGNYSVILVDGTTINGASARSGTLFGGESPPTVDWTGPHRILFRNTDGGSPQVWLDGVHQTGCDFSWPPYVPVTRVGLFGMDQPLSDPFAVRGFAATDLDYWTSTLSDAEVVADYERYALAFR